MKGTEWTREDELVVLWLYYTLQGSTDKSNPEVIRIADALGRNPDGEYRHSPSSVTLKLSNYRACDPNRIGGMAHTSNDDKFYFKQYHDNTEQLFSVVQKILLEHPGPIPLVKVYPDIPEFAGDKYTSGTTGYAEDKISIAKVRTKQYQFRTELMHIYEGKCCLSGIGARELLIASHIKPWAVDPSHRTDPQNGLLLNSLLDRAFDQGLFTINPQSYTVRIAQRIKDKETKAFLLDYQGKQINLPNDSKWKNCNPSKEMLEYHNDMVFEHFSEDSTISLFENV